MAAHERMRIGCEGVLEGGHCRTVERVAERHRGVAAQHGGAAPAECRWLIAPFERAAAQPKKLDERGCRERVVHRGEPRGSARAGQPRGRARLLAEVAAPDPIADERTQVARDRVRALRQVGDAASRVDRVIAAERPGRAGGDAAFARSARLLQRRAGYEFERGHDLAEKHERARARHDRVRVLSDPREPRTLRERALGERCRIARERAGGLARKFVDRGGHAQQEFAHRAVRVARPRIIRNAAVQRRAPSRARRRVRNRDAHDAAGAREQRVRRRGAARVGSIVRPRREVAPLERRAQPFARSWVVLDARTRDRRCAGRERGFHNARGPRGGRQKNSKSGCSAA